VLNIALPALVLELVPRIHFQWHLWFLVVSQWAVLGGVWLLFSWLGPKLQWPRERTGAMILVCGLGNTSFVGYPMLDALRGREGLALGVVADQAGCFIALAVGGITVAALYSGRRPQPRQILRRVLLFPAFLALVAGIVAGLCGGWPQALADILARLGSTLTPLALFSVGLQFRLHLGRAQLGALGLGLGWKLLLAPALVYATGWLLGIHGLILIVGVLQAAMAPMISAAILADQNGLDPPLANSVLGAGIVLSLLTVPLINSLL
jgi:predicted permease